MVRNIPKTAKPNNIICQGYQQGKQRKSKFPTKDYYTTKSLEIIHVDLCGPMRTREFEGERYFMLLIDNYTRMTYATFLREF